MERHSFRAPFPWLEIRSTEESRRPYAPHFHSAFSVGLIRKGKTRFTAGGVERIALPGEIILIEPGLVHSCNPVAGAPRSYDMLYIDDSKDLLLSRSRPILRIVDDFALFREIAQKIDAFRETGMDTGFLDALKDVQNRHCAPSSAPPELPFPPLSFLRQESPLGREAFIRAFRRRHGLSPLAWRHCLRLEKGRRLIREGVSIVNAALSSGYADQPHFHRMFVRYFSATPGQYRRSSLSFKKTT